MRIWQCVCGKVCARVCMCVCFSLSLSCPRPLSYVSSVNFSVRSHLGSTLVKRTNINQPACPDDVHGLCVMKSGLISLANTLKLSSSKNKGFEHIS